MSAIYLTEADIQPLATMKDAISVVEQAFQNLGYAQPPVGLTAPLGSDQT